MGCFWGRPRPHFIAGLTGLVSSWGTFKVGKGASSSSNSAVASSSSSSMVVSRLSGLML